MISPQQIGRNFENRVHDWLQKTRYVVHREIDVRRLYGSYISAIDHMIICDHHIICIQDKFQATTVSISQTNHFIQSVIAVHIKTGRPCIGIYLSRHGLSKLSAMAFTHANQNPNVYFYEFSADTEEEIIKKFLVYLYDNNIYMYEDKDCIMLD